MSRTPIMERPRPTRLIPSIAQPRFQGPWLLLVALLLLGAVLRWVNLGDNSLGYDEGFTWWVAGQAPLRIIRIIQQDTWPPLYYLIMHAWMGIWGDSEFAMRSQSALASTLTMIVGAVLAWRIFPSRGARLLAVGLLAVSAMQLEFAQTVRCYATASLLVLLTLLAIIRRVEGAGRHWNILYIISAAALVYQHNVMWFYLASLHITWLIWPGKQSLRQRVWEMVLTDTAVALLFAPWAPSLLGQFRHVDKAFWVGRPAFYDLSFVASGLSGMVLPVLSEAANAIGVHDSSYRLIRLSAFGLIGLVISASLIATPRLMRRRLLGLLACGVGPVLLVFVYSRFRQSIFIDRVFTPTSAVMPLIFAAVAMIVVPYWRRIAVTATAAMLILMGTSTALLYSKPPVEPWREAMTSVQQKRQPGDLVLFFACEGELIYDYYAARQGWEPMATGGVPVDFRSNDPPRVQLRVDNDADLTPLIKRLNDPAVGRVFLVNAHVGWIDRDSLVARYFEDNWYTDEVVEWTPITISTYSRQSGMSSAPAGTNAIGTSFP